MRSDDESRIVTAMAIPEDCDGNAAVPHPEVEPAVLDHQLPFSSLYDGFLAMAARKPDQTIIRDAGRNTTYRDLETASRAAARALMALGLRGGERVGIWAINHADWIVAGLANQAAGGVLIPASTRLKPREVADILRRGRARLLFCDSGFGDEDFVSGIAAEELPDLAQIVIFGDGPDEGRVLGWNAFVARGAAVNEATLDARMAATGPHCLADILFTSGTTGMPKGVPMTHAQSLIACEQQQLCVSRFVEGDVFAITYPFAHNAGYRAGWQAALLYGIMIIPVRSYDPLDFLKLIDAERVSVLPAVPTIFQGILNHRERDRYDLSTLRRAMTGATVVPVPLVERMQATFGIDAVTTGYGLTECAGSVSNTRSGDKAQTIALTTGQPLDNLEVRLIDAAGAQQPQGEPGEIVVRGPQVLTGYFEDEAATTAAFTADGFFRTGDVGVFDAEGNLRITDRIKDMYIVGGFNTYPAEIEQQLARLDGVAEAAVIGVDDARLGQVGRAFIVRLPDSALDEASVIAWCRDVMANYKVPRTVTFVDMLPRNPTGKVSKVALREMA